MKKVTPLTVDIVNFLLSAAQSHLIHSNYRSIADLVDKEIMSLLTAPQELPYNPFRMKNSKKQKKNCDELFPRKRTLIRVNIQNFTEYKTSISRLSIEQFNLNPDVFEEVTNRYAIEVLLWIALKKHNIELISPYFDDNELLDLVNSDQMVHKAIMDVFAHIGRSPSAREYEMNRRNFGGPSLSFIKSEYGSFNNAKAKLQLELWEWKGEK